MICWLTRIAACCRARCTREPVLASVTLPSHERLCPSACARSLLNPLFASLTTLSGVGPKLEKLYRRLLGRDEAPRVVDLLFHLPTGAIDRRARPKLRDVVPGTVVTVAVTVDRHRPPPPHRPRAPYLIYASDDTGDLVLTYFNAPRGLSGEALSGRRACATSPAPSSSTTACCRWCIPTAWSTRPTSPGLPLVEPVYPLTEGLALRQLRKAIDAALAKLPELPEWQDAAWLARKRFPAFRRSAAAAAPAGRAGRRRCPESPAWSRLAYDELLAGQLALALVRAHLRRPAGRAQRRRRAGCASASSRPCPIR